jgi:hypothetical protein
MSLALPGAAAGAEEPSYVLRAEDVACLQANAETYRALPGDPLFVSVVDCPEVPSNPLLGTLTNEGPDVRLSEEQAWDSFVYLTRAQLDCLLTAAPAAGAALLSFDAARCSLDARE